MNISQTNKKSVYFGTGCCAATILCLSAVASVGQAATVPSVVSAPVGAGVQCGHSAYGLQCSPEPRAVRRRRDQRARLGRRGRLGERPAHSDRRVGAEPRGWSADGPADGTRRVLGSGARGLAERGQGFAHHHRRRGRAHQLSAARNVGDRRRRKRQRPAERQRRSAIAVRSRPRAGSIPGAVFTLTNLTGFHDKGMNNHKPMEYVTWDSLSTSVQI